MEASKLKTNGFKKKYLVEGAAGKGYGFYKMVAESRGTDRNRIAGIIRRMDYTEFLQTRYWGIVAQEVKARAGWRCEECGNKKDLVVHHEDYREHGYDMYHIDKLHCLCRDCHEVLHGIRERKSVCKKKVYSNKTNSRQNTRVSA